MHYHIGLYFQLGVSPSVGHCSHSCSALPSAAKSREESLPVQGVCLCVELSRVCGRSAFNFFRLSMLGHEDLLPTP